MTSTAESAETQLDAETVEYVEDISAEYGICPELVMAIIEAESSGRQYAQNGNCKGLMQVNDQIHAERMEKLRVTDIFDKRGNILCGVDYIMELAETYDDVYIVLQYYHGESDAGDGSSAYADKILARSHELEVLHGK